ncbi:hypothetical protein [Kutzneria albida]|uniref:Uncharacterized protein n=1 Tax=Kutzneria albida DSM 43870 TaxID=1449976 RepID=W5WAS7_9PSEU|nr:hypothetical protein [Kutzneria albida]AHH98228.1 hypothetical protein KALB_4866 [Kutzneria albida DSM 43870]
MNTPPIQHGTLAAVWRHRRHRTRLCPPCSKVRIERDIAWKIRTGRKPTLAVDIADLQKALTGGDLAVILADRHGALVVDAIRARRPHLSSSVSGVSARG